MQQQFVYHDICDGPLPLNLPIVDDEEVPSGTMGTVVGFSPEAIFKLDLELVI